MRTKSKGGAGNPGSAGFAAKKIALISGAQYEEDAVEVPDHPLPLTAEQAALLRQQPGFQKGTVAVATLLFWQLAAGLVVAALAGLVSQKLFSAVSALYGMLSVVVPGAVFVWGLKRWQRLADGAGRGKGSSGAGGMLAGFFVWEFVKIVLTIVFLALAVKVVVPLDWLALLAGFVVTLKMHWLALWLATKTR